MYAFPLSFHLILSICLISDFVGYVLLWLSKAH
uniref:Uncharacterized protein n=1 Tax=Rhizophora mucronata TaxID=61149 RepID=A0A2P2NI26_RHIMU